MEQNTVIGIFSLIASTIGLPTLFKGGILFDKKKKAFQEFSGFMGKTKTEWIPFENVAYLSIVNVRGRDSAPNYMIYEKAKLFAIYERGHEELYSDFYEEVRAIADWLHVVFEVELYDKVLERSK